MDERGRSAVRALLYDRRGLSTMEYSVLLVLLLLGAVMAWRSLGNALRVKVESGSAVLAEALADGYRAADGNAPVSSTERDTHAAVAPARSQELLPAATSNGASTHQSLAGGIQVRSDSAAARSASAVTTRATSGGIVSVAQTALSTSISAAKAVWDTWQEVREGMIADEVRYLQAHPEAMLTVDSTRDPSPRELRSAAEARFMAQGFALGPLKVLGAASKGALAGRLLGKVKSLFGVPSGQVATRAGQALSKVLPTLGTTDARLVGRAAELAGRGSGNFADDLAALSKATTEVVGQHGKVLFLGELGGQQIFGSQISRIGIVASEQGTLVVRAPAGKTVEVLGRFK
jgi:hypothetical protein